MCRSLEKHARKLMIWLKRFNLQPHHNQQACFQSSFFFQPRYRGFKMLFMREMVERLDQMFLRMEVVVGVTERDAGALSNGAHGCLFVATLPKHVQGGLQNRSLRLSPLVGGNGSTNCT